jgi:putative phage-type endonuclease
MGAIALPQRQRTPEWRSARQAGIGSSDAAVIAGVSPWSDIRTLFAEKVGWAAPVLETRQMKFGIALEAVVATAYSEKTGRKVRRVRRMLRHRELPWMLASLDRVVIGEMRLVEIKTARFASDEWGPDGSDEIPDHVRIQVEHQMAVTGYPLADVVVLFAGSDLRTYTIARDHEIQADLLGMERAFWSAVQAKSLPADLAELGARPVPLREGEIAATEQITALVAQLRVARTNYDQVETAKKELEAALRAELADIGTVRGDGFRISYRPQADRRQVGWEQIAAAYRSKLEAVLPQLLDDPDADTHVALAELDMIRDLFTTTAPGIRPLRLTYSKPADEEPL